MISSHVQGNSFEMFEKERKQENKQKTTIKKLSSSLLSPSFYYRTDIVFLYFTVIF